MSILITVTGSWLATFTSSAQEVLHLDSTTLSSPRITCKTCQAASFESLFSRIRFHRSTYANVRATGSVFQLAEHRYNLAAASVEVDNFLGHFPRNVQILTMMRSTDTQS